MKCDCDYLNLKPRGWLVWLRLRTSMTNMAEVGWKWGLKDSAEYASWLLDTQQERHVPKHWAAPELFLYPGFYESGPHRNDLDVVLCCVLCSLSSGAEASMGSPCPGLTWAFFHGDTAQLQQLWSHTELLVMFPANKALRSWALLCPPHHGSAVKCSQAAIPTSLSIKTSQSSREGQTISSWLSSRAYTALLAYR